MKNGKGLSDEVTSAQKNVKYTTKCNNKAVVDNMVSVQCLTNNQHLDILSKLALYPDSTILVVGEMWLRNECDSFTSWFRLLRKLHKARIITKTYLTKAKLEGYINGN